ncbi:hypothetical protein SXANM310S_02941 [Streptomyces xanthochromogenes]
MEVGSAYHSCGNTNRCRFAGSGGKGQRACAGARRPAVRVAGRAGAHHLARRSADRRGRRTSGAAAGFDDASADLVAVRVAGPPLDDHPGRQVTRFGIAPVGAGLERRSVSERKFHEVMLPIRNRPSPRVGAWLVMSVTPLDGSVPPGRLPGATSAPGPPSAVVGRFRSARSGRRWSRARCPVTPKECRPTHMPCRPPQRSVRARAALRRAASGSLRAPPLGKGPSVYERLVCFSDFSDFTSFTDSPTSPRAGPRRRRGSRRDGSPLPLRGRRSPGAPG